MSEQHIKKISGERIQTKEPSLFVIGISLEQAKKTARKFGQTWFIYSGPETNGKVCGFNPQTGEKVVEWDKFRPMVVAQYFSQIKGKPYTFEAFELKPTWMEGMIGQHIVREIPNFKRHYLPEKYWSRSVSSAADVEKVLTMNSIVDSLLEGGFSRMMQIMKAKVPSVRTFGILTAWNPSGKLLTKEQNELRNKELAAQLRAGAYGYVVHKGKFGEFERPFFVPHITRSALVALGKAYDQASVIYGEREGDKVRFELINANTGETENVRYQVLADTGVQAHKDFYSEVGGKKFQVDTGRKFRIPFFDEQYESSDWDDSHLYFFTSADGFSDSEARKLVERIAQCELALAAPLKTEKWYWHHRGIMLENLRKLKKLKNREYDETL